MENNHFSLSTNETNKLINTIRILFGIICIAVSIFWLIFNIKTLKADITLWVTIIFLAGFGFYQIWSGMGLATRFIEIGNESILLKKNAVLPAVKIAASEIEKIELFPLNIVFFLKTKKKIFLRFGTTYYEINEKIKTKVFNFAEMNNIEQEIIEEDL